MNKIQARQFVVLTIAALLLIAATATITLTPGNALLIQGCTTRLTLSTQTVSCAAKSRTPTRTRTVTPSPTRTATPTVTASVTATSAAMSATPTPGANALDPVPAVALGTCTAAIHDRYAVVGPDGRLYRTWHPQTVPVDAANPAGAKCAFAHEHGDDPTKSVANPALPPFGYIGYLVGAAEPHVGFKVQVANKGDVNDEGRVMIHNTRVVYHQGTGGAARFATQFHSFMFDMTDGTPGGPRWAHVLGMGDTGGVATLCAGENALGGKRVMPTFANRCPAITSLYEIWNFHFQIESGRRFEILVSAAVFDPITVMGLDPSQTIYTAAEWGAQFGTNEHGCDREVYNGPMYLRNAGQGTEIRTDAFGNVDPHGLFVQSVSNVGAIGITTFTNFTADQGAFKLRRSFCAPGLGVGN